MEGETKRCGCCAREFNSAGDVWRNVASVLGELDGLAYFNCACGTTLVLPSSHGLRGVVMSLSGVRPTRVDGRRPATLGEAGLAGRHVAPQPRQ